MNTNDVLTKLIAEIERYENTAINAYNPHGEDADFWNGKVVACEDLKTIITSLQQELSQLPGIEDPGIPGKDFIPVEWVDACEMYGKWKIVKREQPEVDLDEEMLDYINKHYHIRYDETLEVGNDPLTTYDFEEIARYFYELGLRTRKDV